MQIRIFAVPVTDTGVFTEELNRFLKGNKILEVESQLVSNANGAFWCFCVKYIEASWSQNNIDRNKTDYKTELDEKTFDIFSKLREARKQIAAEESIPAYAVCTDTELAAMAKLSELSLKNLQTVRGFGEKKAEKFGKRIIELYQNKIQDEKGGEII